MREEEKIDGQVVTAKAHQVAAAKKLSVVLVRLLQAPDPMVLEYPLRVQTTHALDLSPPHLEAHETIGTRQIYLRYRPFLQRMNHYRRKV